MKAKELRIGNYIGFGNIDQIERVEIIKEQALGVYSDCEFDTLTPIELFEPIPLTEEWLLKMGFENYDGSKWERCGIIILNYNDGCIYLANQLHVNIFYVHQLQNLFFSLIGEELTIVQL